MNSGSGGGVQYTGKLKDKVERYAQGPHCKKCWKGGAVSQNGLRLEHLDSTFPVQIKTLRE